MEDCGRNFEDCFEWRVGNEKEVLFSKDVWEGKRDLKSKFPRLFSFCGYKECNLVLWGVV